MIIPTGILRICLLAGVILAWTLSWIPRGLPIVTQIIPIPQLLGGLQLDNAVPNPSHPAHLAVGINTKSRHRLHSLASGPMLTDTICTLSKDGQVRMLRSEREDINQVEPTRMGSQFPSEPLFVACWTGGLTPFC